jgi:hypothetical protein
MVERATHASIQQLMSSDVPSPSTGSRPSFFASSRQDLRRESEPVRLSFIFTKPTFLIFAARSMSSA